MKCVIIYTYFKSKSADFNLAFFAKNELKIRENIDYIIVVNGFICDIQIPEISNVIILKRENIGFDFGGHNHALKYIEDNKKEYDYYFFMNSGVIGPILPHYLRVNSLLHWTDFFINKINNNIKLVGTTIVCLPESDDGGKGPKVEGFFFVTDKIGLALFKNEKTIFCDHKTKYSAIINGEYGLSNCIFKNGYTIDCMLHLYNNIDWTNKNNWDKNDCIHPSRYNSFYGKSIDPYDVIFHKWYWNNLPTVNFEIIKNYVDKIV